MSEVIESYIRRNSAASEKEAFEGFLREERIKAWVGSDEGRKERLRREFGRVWGAMHAEGQIATQHGRVGPSGPAPSSPDVRGARVQVTTEAQVAPSAPVAPAVREPMPALTRDARRLQVMCSSCRGLDVWMDGSMIACRRCGKQYDDMLQLIRVTPVGPFEFLFGDGWVGYATAGGIALALIGLYGVLRWV